MKSESTCQPQPQHHSIPRTPKEFFVECDRCRRVCYSDSLGEVTFDDETELAIVRVGQEALCGRCLEAQIQQEMQEARVLEERFIYYKQFQSSFEERQMQRGRVHAKSELLLEGQEELDELQAQQAAVTLELTQLREASLALKEKFYTLQAEEEKFWEGINKIERRTNKVEEKSLNTKFDRTLSKTALDDLSKMSVLHLFLDIRVDDSLAYVQGMAMGRRGQGGEVSWEEVAVGLGHLLIGLHFLALKYSYEYKKIQDMVLKGAQSEVMLRGKKKANVTIWSKDSQRQFGELLEALLVETAYLGQHILEAENIEYSQEFRMPFLINTTEYKVVDLWVDPLKHEERTRWTSWTKAMRYFMIDFKHMATVYAINDKHL